MVWGMVFGAALGMEVVRSAGVRLCSRNVGLRRIVETKFILSESKGLLKTSPSLGLILPSNCEVTAAALVGAKIW